MRHQIMMHNLYGLKRIESNRAPGIRARQALERFHQNRRQLRQYLKQQQEQLVYDSTPSELYGNQLPDLVQGIQTFYESNERMNLHLPQISQEELMNLCSALMMSQASTSQSRPN